MEPHQMHAAPGAAPAKSAMSRILAAMSVVTMAMTVPQVWLIWVRHEASGVSLVSWSAYLASALLWFWHGLRLRDRNIYLACIGWIVLDAGVITGVLVYS
ncbi:MAG TPA: hypothetical protein VF428_01760 [Casimicrobiaceae bacterium]